MESHREKISFTLSMWALSSPDPGHALTVAFDLMGHMQRGREPSMYSDLHTDPDRAETPRDRVRDRAARDCVTLAEDCLAYAHRHVIEKTPATVATAHDRLFTMKSAKFRELLNTEDFWRYFISRMQAGHHDIAEAVFGCERDHIRTGNPFGDA